MTTKLVKGLRAAGGSSETAEDKETLSPREHEILGYVAKGASNKEIARALGLARQIAREANEQGPGPRRGHFQQLLGHEEALALGLGHCLSPVLHAVLLHLIM